MRHYYNEAGVLDYTANPALLTRLKLALPDIPKAELRHAVLSFAAELLLDYELNKSMTIRVQSAWQQVMLELFIDFITDDYVPGEFVLVAWYSTVRVQAEFIL